MEKTWARKIDHDRHIETRERSAGTVAQEAARGISRTWENNIISKQSNEKSTLIKMQLLKKLLSAKNIVKDLLASTILAIVCCTCSSIRDSNPKQKKKKRNC